MRREGEIKVRQVYVTRKPAAEYKNTKQRSEMIVLTVTTPCIQETGPVFICSGLVPVVKTTQSQHFSVLASFYYDDYACLTYCPCFFFLALSLALLLYTMFGT